MGFAEYDRYDGLGLAELVRKKQVAPAELVDEAIRRIEQYNPMLNVVVHKQFERARKQAAGARPGGPFGGVPFLLKDLMGEDAGEPSTSSCKLLVSWRADRDAELVARFKRAGVIILGRTNTPEFGIYGVTESALRGPARNPWDTTRTTGGSSGGSAGAVAARMVPLAHGGDGGGSIRIPASHCGLVGLKPTRARNPAGPFVGERWGGIVSEHVLTRSVRDCAAMLDATQGPDLGAPYQVLPPTRPFQSEVGAPVGKLRVAFTAKALFGDGTHPDCVTAVERSAALCRELGHEVEEACPSFDKATLIKAYLVLVASGVALNVRLAGERAGRRPRPDDFEPATWLMKLIADKCTATELAYYRSAMQKAAREIAAFFECYDVLLTPTVAMPPVPIGTYALTDEQSLLVGLLSAMPLRSLLMLARDKMAAEALAATPNTQLWNLTGQPALSLPLHWSDAGLPIGTQLVGRFGEEGLLLRLGSQLEEARPWATRVPALVKA